MFINFYKKCLLDSNFLNDGCRILVVFTSISTLQQIILFSLVGLLLRLNRFWFDSSRKNFKRQYKIYVLYVFRFIHRYNYLEMKIIYIILLGCNHTYLM